MRWSVAVLVLCACEFSPAAVRTPADPPAVKPGPVAQPITGAWTVSWASAASPALAPTGAKCWAKATITMTRQDSILAGNFTAFQISCDGHQGANLSGTVRGIVAGALVRFYLGPPGDDDFTQLGTFDAFSRTMTGKASLTFSPYGVGISDDATLFTIQTPFSAK